MRGHFTIVLTLANLAVACGSQVSGNVDPSHSDSDRRDDGDDSVATDDGPNDPNDGQVTIGAVVSGVFSSGLVLEDGKGQRVEITGDGAWTFSATYDSGESFALHIVGQPARAQCAASGGTGVITDADVTVTITCSAFALDALALSHVVTLSWPTAAGLTYDLHWSLDAACDGSEPCEGETEANGVAPPYDATGLVNARPYFFTVHAKADGEATASTTADAQPNSLSPNVPPTALATSEETVYLGGLSWVAPYTGAAFPTDPRTGRVRGRYPHGQGAQANAVVADGSGGWFVGGPVFYTTRAGTRGLLVHLLADGTVDADFDFELGGGSGGTVGYDYVTSLARDGDTLYVAGGFDTVNGESRPRLAAISVSTRTLTAWNPGADGIVYALAVADGVVYAGGTMDNAGGAVRNRVAAFDAAGALLPWDANVTGSIIDDIVVADGTVYLAGTFSAVAGQARSGIAAMTTAGELTPLAVDVSSAKAVAVEAGVVYIGGAFTTVAGQDRDRLAAVTATGELLPWRADITGNQVLALTMGELGLYVGGNFRRVGDQVRQNLACVSRTGDVLPWDVYADFDVLAFAIADDAVYVGGHITHAGGVSRGGVAAFSSDGVLLPWNPGLSRVSAMTMLSGVLYVGGAFDAVGGEPRSHLAAFDSSGALTPWNPGSDGTFISAMTNDGVNIFIGGNMTSVGGQARVYLAAIGPNGAPTSWNPGSDGVPVRMIASGGNIYVTGGFTTIGGATRANLAALAPDGSAIATFAPEPNGTISALTADGSSLFVAGAFTTFGGLSRTHSAAISLDGTTVRDWNPTIVSTTAQIVASAGIVYLGDGLVSAVTVAGTPVALTLEVPPDNFGAQSFMHATADRLFISALWSFRENHGLFFAAHDLSGKLVF